MKLLGDNKMPITLTEAWTGPNGLTFPSGTEFVHSATHDVWDWKTPNGDWGQSWFKDVRPGQYWFDGRGV
jgi:hypothetical protein